MLAAKQVSLVEESSNFLSKVSLLNQFSADEQMTFNLVLPGDLITKEPGFIQ